MTRRLGRAIHGSYSLPTGKVPYPTDGKSNGIGQHLYRCIAACGIRTRENSLGSCCEMPSYTNQRRGGGSK